LRAIDGFSQVVLEDYGDRLDSDGIDALNRVRRASSRMDRLITALLGLSRITRTPIHRQPLDLSQIARDVAENISSADIAAGKDSIKRPQFAIQESLRADADEQLVTVIFDNLLRNAVKFSRGNPMAPIEVGGRDGVFWVRDHGVGFNPAHADKLFQPFERLHAESEFPGTGIGLATVQRIVRRHGGEICAEGAEGEGATFYFTLSPRDDLPPSPGESR
jgi:signal transduction histidine kinase